MATKLQITKKLLKNGVVFTDGENVKISRDEVEVHVDYTEKNGYGECNEERTENLANLISEVLGFNLFNWTQYGSVILSQGVSDESDFNDVSSPMHY